MLDAQDAQDKKKLFPNLQLRQIIINTVHDRLIIILPFCHLSLTNGLKLSVNLTINVLTIYFAKIRLFDETAKRLTKKSPESSGLLV